MSYKIRDVHGVEHEYEAQQFKEPAAALGVARGWIQWQGTDVCMDVHCQCGHHGHVHGDFVFYIKCPKCGQSYELGGNVKLYPIAFEPENVTIADL